MAENLRVNRRNGPRNARNHQHVHVVHRNRERQDETNEILKLLIARMAKRVTDMHRNMENNNRNNRRHFWIRAPFLSVTNFSAHQNRRKMCTKRAGVSTDTYYFHVTALALFICIITVFIASCYALILR